MNKVVDAARCTDINDLPDDVLLDILSRLYRMDRYVDAVRTSILSRKWRYLPSLICPSPGPLTLVFDHRDLPTRSFGGRAQFIEWVDRVLKLHSDASLDGLIFRSSNLKSSRAFSWTRQEDIKPGDVEKLVYHAVSNGVKVFEVECYFKYEFLFLKTMPPRFLGVESFAFVSLTFVGVDIGDEVIHYILARCPHLEKLCIRKCSCTKDLRVARLPSLKFLEISYAQRLEISVLPSLVSCMYGGNRLIIPSKHSPNLRELTLKGNVAWYFVHDPFEHASYSHQLVKLELNFLTMFGPSLTWYQRPDLPRLGSLKHLELNLILPIGKSIHFFIKFINGSPLLKQIRINISYVVKDPRSKETLGFPEESPSTNLDRRHHKNLKVVKMSGYVGCAIDDKFILRILNIAHESLKTVAIDTESEYYDQKPWDCATQCNPKGRSCGFCSARDNGARTRGEAKRRANQLKLSFPPTTKTVLVVT